MTLPRLLLLTDVARMQPSFEVALIAAMRGGARLVQLREKTLPPRDVLSLAIKAQRVCETFGAQVVVNGRADIARAAHLAGVHLPENDLAPRDVRATIGQHALCGVSVHNLETAQRASDEGADYLVFGSVFPTASHPNGHVAGLEMLRQVCDSIHKPVFAIGGVTAQNAAQCLEAGAHGVAVISAVWQSSDVQKAVHELNAALAV
jgi:thiamine-phosphate diphosphorylase